MFESTELVGVCALNLTMLLLVCGFVVVVKRQTARFIHDQSAFVLPIHC